MSRRVACRQATSLAQTAKNGMLYMSVESKNGKDKNIATNYVLA